MASTRKWLEPPTTNTATTTTNTATGITSTQKISSKITGTRDQRKSYTCSFKLKVVVYAEKYSNSKAAETFSVHRRRVQEWKNQKSRLVEQVKNFNGSTKRLKGGGRKLKSNEDLEPYLTDYLSILTDADKELKPEIVLNEAKRIDSKFKGGIQWARLFIEDFLSHQLPPLKREIDKTPPLPPDPTPCISSDNELEEYFEKIEEDENHVIKYLNKWLRSFIENYKSCDRIDREMLEELLFIEGQKTSGLFGITPLWISKFLDLNKYVFAQHENYRKENILTDDNYDINYNSNRRRVLEAFHNKTFSIHEWLDNCTEHE